MTNLEQRINQKEEHIVTNKFKYHLLSIKGEHQERIRPNLHHPTYNEPHEKIIELIDWTLEKYKECLKKPQQYEEEQEVIIDNIIEELDKKRE